MHITYLYVYKIRNWDRACYNGPQKSTQTQRRSAALLLLFYDREREKTITPAVSSSLYISAAAPS